VANVEDRDLSLYREVDSLVHELRAKLGPSRIEIVGRARRCNRRTQAGQRYRHRRGLVFLVVVNFRGRHRMALSGLPFALTGAALALAAATPRASADGMI
jgi:hypothetical protein